MIVKEKIEQAKNILKEFNIDCWITFVRESQINGDPSLIFLTNSAVTWHSAFIISKTGKTYAVVGKYDAATVKELGVYDVVEDFVTSFKKPLSDILWKMNPMEIAVNYSEGSEICDGITHGMFLTLQNMLKEMKMENRIISSEKIVSALRERKSKTEIDYMKEAIRHTLEIYDIAAKFIRPGQTEKEIAGYMTKELKRRGLEPAWEESVCPSVFTGPIEAEAHYNPTDRVVQKGHVLNMDFGVKVNGYCSDLQRTFYILADGESEPPEDVMKGFNTIVNSIEASKNAMKPGVKGIEIDSVAREFITSAGYAEFPHALGHQVGRFSHDGTALLGPAWEKYADKPFKKLEEGMVFTIEPRLTVAGKGVATIEEMVLITTDGCEWLSKPQKELVIIR
ncbi:MAG: Xaa-Pro peptidase family protein [bacterium]